MADRAVDLLAAGPYPTDPYDPAAPAWSLAEGLRDRGAAVRVLFPSGPDPPTAPARIDALPLDVVTRRPGAAIEPAEFARSAGRRIRPGGTLVLRDPAGLGPLAVPHRASGARIDAIVRSVQLADFDLERNGRRSANLLDRVDTWRDRRSVRRLERAALEEADRILCDAPALAAALSEEYSIAPERIGTTVPPVAPEPAPPTREEARTALALPTDVPVVAAVAASENTEASGIDRAREAFRRIRPLFPGVRLVVAGAEAPTEPGVHPAPGRDRRTLVTALAAADVAVFARRTPGFDPGLVLALQLGVAPVALATAHLPVEPNDAVRYVVGDDPGDLSSAVAELVADLAQRRALAAQGPPYAARYLPGNVAAALLAAPGS